MTYQYKSTIIINGKQQYCYTIKDGDVVVCDHFVMLSPTATDEDIAFVGDCVVAITENYLPCKQFDNGVCRALDIY